MAVLCLKEISSLSHINIWDIFISTYKENFKLALQIMSNTHEHPLENILKMFLRNL